MLSTAVVKLLRRSNRLRTHLGTCGRTQSMKWRVIKVRSILAGAAVAALTGSTFAIIGAAAPASAVVQSCSSAGAFTTSGSCTVGAGETVYFSIRGGDGGAGGPGGAGGNGGKGWDGTDTLGGRGARGGEPGLGGRGAVVTGSWTNTTASTVTLTIEVGVNGIAGANGAPGIAGRDAAPPFVTSGEGGSAGSGGSGGGDGVPSVIADGGTIIAFAGGGTGGGGGAGGNGGSGGDSSGAGTDGLPSPAGVNGFDGAVQPNPLPDGWTLVAAESAPSVMFLAPPVPTPEPTPTTEPVVTPAYTG